MRSCRHHSHSPSVSYDLDGNLTQRAPNTGSTTTSCFDVEHEIIKNVTGIAPSCIMSATTSFTSDGAGERTGQTPSSGGSVPCGTSTTGICYTYNAAQELTKYQAATSTSYAYAYDGLGLRMSKTPSSGVAEPYVWDLSGSMPTIAMDGTTDYVPDGNGEVLASIDSFGTPTYYGHDWLGSTRELYNSSGTSVGTYTHDVYGNVVSHTLTATTPFGYTGSTPMPRVGWCMTGRGTTIRVLSSS
jgi:YD repeat-containing protein